MWATWVALGCSWGSAITHHGTRQGWGHWLCYNYGAGNTKVDGTKIGCNTPILEGCVHICTFLSTCTRAGTRLFKNRRLIEYLKEATRSARLGTRSVLGAAGKVEIWIIFDIKQSKKCQHKTSTEAERVFSWMGWLLNKRRLSMSGETVSMQLFLKDNLVLWTFVSFWLLYLYLAFW